MKRTRKLTDKKQLSFVKYKDLSSCNKTRQEVVAVYLQLTFLRQELDLQYAYIKICIVSLAYKKH